MPSNTVVSFACDKFLSYSSRKAYVIFSCTLFGTYTKRISWKKELLKKELSIQRLRYSWVTNLISEREYRFLKSVRAKKSQELMKTESLWESVWG